MNSRTIEMTVTNWTDMTLYYNSKYATHAEGPVMSPSTATFAAKGGSATLTASNSGLTYSGDAGTVSLTENSTGTGGAYTWYIRYQHPESSSPSYVELQTPSAQVQFTPYSTPCCVGTYYQIYSGNPITPTFNVYMGVAVDNPDGTIGYAVPLADKPYSQVNNCQDFANSMFGPNMRSGSLIQSFYNQPGAIPYKPADFSGGQMSKIVGALAYGWQKDSGADAPILNFLKGYIAPGSPDPIMNLWVPVISYTGQTSKQCSIYQLKGYEQIPLASYAANGDPVWNMSAVETFLTMLVGGAHMVAISAYDDLTNSGLSTGLSRCLLSKFTQSNLKQRSDTFNSHYKSVGNVTGYYYLNITTEGAPLDCGFILALLFGSTVNGVTSPAAGSYNSFMQLEGWPANGLGNTRHNADYAAYQESLWNTSTYGACPYSEKRATTVFLAPPGWTPQLYQTTYMMPYVGAYATGVYPNGAPQKWVDTSIVTLPTGVNAPPQLPPQYYVS